MPTWHIFGAPVRNETTYEIDPALIGQPITIVTRDTTTPFPIVDGAGDPIPDSALTVSTASALPAFGFESATPMDVYLDWYQASSGKRGQIWFEEVVRDLARSAVKSFNGILPDEDGDVQVDVSGVDDTGLADLIATPTSDTALALQAIYGAGIWIGDLDEPRPVDLPLGTIVGRVAGGITPPPVPVVYMTDDFERTVAAGSVGTPSGGGEYSAIDIPADWSVSSGAARWIAPAAGARTGYLRSSTYSQETVEIVGMISQVTGAVGNRIWTIAPRRISTSSVQYGANIVLRGPTATRPLQVDLGLQKGATEGDLQATVAGAVTTGALGDLVRFRMRITQVDPATTQVQARIWLDGTTEPTTWQRDATDTTAALQGAGTLAIGVRQNSGETVGSEARIHEYTVQSVV